MSHTWTDLAYTWFGDLGVVPWWGWVATLIMIFGGILGPGIEAMNSVQEED
ncbi:hypothetical protein [Actinoplanes sp. TFC3]|uniref:hypothetical protein n=1 Tax=Actinoplanes sp. TFC3 TaxID=1710355 RepID=UPI000B29A32A|nr:hypothetical protein [Actinoplanes sp. TFC3]